jgi:hypothetical protein
VTNPATIIDDRDNSEKVFTSPSGQFYHDGTTWPRLSGLSHLDNFAWTRKLAYVYRDYLGDYMFTKLEYI